METKKKKRTMSSKLSIEDRFRILKAYKRMPVYKYIATRFNCSRYLVKNIVTQKNTILNEYARRSTGERSKTTVNSQCVKLLEEVLFEWFRRAQCDVKNGSITNEIFMEKAQEIKQIFCITGIQIDMDWVLKYRTKYDITDLDMTLLRIDTDQRPLDLDMNEIAGYVVDQNPILEDLECTSPPLLSDFSDDLDVEGSNPISCPIVDLCSVTSGSSNDVSKKVEGRNNNFDETQRSEPPTIGSVEEALRYLQPLEDYVLMKENFRAIGLIDQLAEILKRSEND